MTEVGNRWGVGVTGTDFDKAAWSDLLRPPFEPFVETVAHRGADHLVLRSKSFAPLTHSKDVYDAAKHEIAMLNVVLGATEGARPLAVGMVFEFQPDGAPRTHVIIEVEPARIVVRAGRVRVFTTGPDGEEQLPPPKSSRAQDWVRAAKLDAQVGDALKYLAGTPGWVELYKAYEQIKHHPRIGGPKKNQLSRFSWTANSGDKRHSVNRGGTAPKPMTLREAHSFMLELFDAAINDVLARHH